MPDLDNNDDQRRRLALIISPRLDALSTLDWARLFPATHLGLDEVQVLTNQYPEIQFHSFVVELDNQPVLYLPVFYALQDTAFAKELFTVLNTKPQSLLSLGWPKALGGCLGLDSQLEPDFLNTAWELVFEAFQSLANSLKVNAKVLNYWSQEDKKRIPSQLMNGYQLLTQGDGDYEIWIQLIRKAWHQRLFSAG